MHSDFLISSVYTVVFECHGFQCLASKNGDKEKNEGQKKALIILIPWKLLQPEEVRFATMWGKVRQQNNGCHFFFCTFVKQQSAIRALLFGGQFFFFSPTLIPASCVHTAPGTHTRLPDTGLRSRIWLLLAITVLKFNEINCSLLSNSSSRSCKLSIDPKVLK